MQRPTRFPQERFDEWDVTIRQSLGAAEGPVAVPSGLPDPFSLADPPAVTEILEGAGFADITFTDVSEPLYYGPDVDAAMDWVHGWSADAKMGGRCGDRRILPGWAGLMVVSCRG
jgi:hypothetical protein